MLQEELAAVNLAKYREAQKELQESEERADRAEVAMTRLLRAKNRTSVSVTRTPTVSSCSVKRAPFSLLARSVNYQQRFEGCAIAAVCLPLCQSVCVQHYCKSNQPISLKLDVLFGLPVETLIEEGRLVSE